jgi:hypothetical protein
VSTYRLLYAVGFTPWEQVANLPATTDVVTAVAAPGGPTSPRPTASGATDERAQDATTGGASTGASGVAVPAVLGLERRRAALA